MANVQYIWIDGAWREFISAQAITQTADLQLVTSAERAAIAQPQRFLIDAATGPQTVLLTGSDVEIIKIDTTPNAVTIQPPVGNTVCREATIDLTLQDEAVHLRLIGTNYYRT